MKKNFYYELFSILSLFIHKVNKRLYSYTFSAMTLLSMLELFNVLAIALFLKKKWVVQSHEITLLLLAVIWGSNYFTLYFDGRDRRILEIYDIHSATQRRKKGVGLLLLIYVITSLLAIMYAAYCAKASLQG
jgi:hypothetical protein